MAFESSVEVSIVKEVSAVQEWIVEHQTFAEIASSVSTSVAATGFKFEPSLSATLRDQHTETLRIQSGRTTTSTVTRRENVSVKIHVDGKIVAGDRTYIASNYREHIEVLYLSYIDALAVRYARTGLVGRSKRIKTPEFLDEWHPIPVERRPNVSRPLNIPVCAVRFWEYVPHSHPVFKDAVYPRPAIDFNKVESLPVPPNSFESHPLPFTGPSLYNLSTAAFPLKWSHFKRRRKELADVEWSDDDED